MRHVVVAHVWPALAACGFVTLVDVALCGRRGNKKGANPMSSSQCQEIEEPIQTLHSQVQTLVFVLFFTQHVRLCVHFPLCMKPVFSSLHPHPQPCIVVSYLVRRREPP